MQPASLPQPVPPFAGDSWRVAFIFTDPSGCLRLPLVRNEPDVAGTRTILTVDVVSLRTAAIEGPLTVLEPVVVHYPPPPART